MQFTSHGVSQFSGKCIETKPDQMLFGVEQFSQVKIMVLPISQKYQCLTVQVSYFSKTPCIRLRVHFYEVIVDSAFGLINYRLIESLSFSCSVF